MIARFLSAFLLVVIIIATGYWFRMAHSTCDIPLEYDIGILNEEFDLTREEARTALSDAESLWEDATGQNLFTYTEGANFQIHFVFDERQEETNAERGLREVLDRKEEVNETIRAEYESLLAQYENLKHTYENRVAAYEDDLAVYNGEVAYWNNQEDGAPEEIYERLNRTQEELSEAQEELEDFAEKLNELVDDINTLGERGNQTVEEYNDDVSTYNDRFNHEREFTQGDYRGDSINIYQFDDEMELRLVLAHELGHAISLGHVDGNQSVMHHLMEGQQAELGLSTSDLAEFERICGAR